MVCFWYHPEGTRFGTCTSCAPDSSIDCPCNGESKKCPYTDFGGRVGIEREEVNAKIQEEEDNRW